MWQLVFAAIFVAGFLLYIIVRLRRRANHRWDKRALTLPSRSPRSAAVSASEPLSLEPYGYLEPAVPTRSVILSYLRPDEGDEVAEIFECNVAGINHLGHCGVHRQRVIALCKPGEEIFLVRDRNNQHDENAVCCFRSTGQDIGYLPSALAEDIAPVLDDKQAVLAKIVETHPFTTQSGKQLIGAVVELTLYRRKRRRK